MKTYGNVSSRILIRGNWWR